MRLRFQRSVPVPGGPLYHAGEVAVTDRWLLTETRAQQYVDRGWAIREEEEGSMASTTQAPTQPKSADRPQRDKMLERAPVKKG